MACKTSSSLPHESGSLWPCSSSIITLLYWKPIPGFLLGKIQGDLLVWLLVHSKILVGEVRILILDECSCNHVPSHSVSLGLLQFNCWHLPCNAISRELSTADYGYQKSNDSFRFVFYLLHKIKVSCFSPLVKILEEYKVHAAQRLEVSFN